MRFNNFYNRGELFYIKEDYNKEIIFFIFLQKKNIYSIKKLEM